MWHKSDLYTRSFNFFKKIYFHWEAASMTLEVNLGNMNHNIFKH